MNHDVAVKVEAPVVVRHEGGPEAGRAIEQQPVFVELVSGEGVIGCVLGTSPDGMHAVRHYTHEAVRSISGAVCAEHASEAEEIRRLGRAITAADTFDAPIFCSVVCHAIPVTLTDVGRAYIERLTNMDDAFAQKLAALVMDPGLTWDAVNSPALSVA
jgi:hypothetical protein